MILTSGTLTHIQLVTDAASNINVTGSYVDNNAGVYTPGDVNPANITTAVTTDIIEPPGSGLQRAIVGLTIRNNHASISCNVTIQKSDGTNTNTIMKCNLLAGESLILGENGQWAHNDANGGAYPALGNIASQAEMEAGTSTTVVVTPGRMKYYPGVAKFWVKAGVTGNILSSMNVASLTDTGTGVMGITYTTAFSSTDYCVSVSVEAPATTWGVANAREPHIRNATIATGSVSVDCIDNTATTCLVKDPASWHVSGYGDFS